MMAFIDDDSLADDHRHDECRGPSPSMSLRPPILQNGWGSSSHSRAKQQQQELPKPESHNSSPNVNNNNNNNNTGNVNGI